MAFPRYRSCTCRVHRSTTRLRVTVTNALTVGADWPGSGLTFFETLDDVADERRAVDGHAKQRVGHDAGAQGRARAGHAAPGATRAVIPAGGAALDELMQLGTAERGQAPDVGHVGVERAQRHAHLSQLDVHTAVGQVVRRRGQLAVLDHLNTQTGNGVRSGPVEMGQFPWRGGRANPLRGGGVGCRSDNGCGSTRVYRTLSHGHIVCEICPRNLRREREREKAQKINYTTNVFIFVRQRMSTGTK